MNIEEIDKWLDNEYGVSYTSLEEIHNWLVDEKIKKDKEIERLNNIINELEKWLEDYHNNTGLSEYETGIDDALCDTIKKLNELKGDSSNER